MYEDKRARRAGRSRAGTAQVPVHSQSPYVPDHR
jgi:hypothetical protein